MVRTDMSMYETIVKLALERGFYAPSCEIYGDAPAGFWEYGPNGANMKNLPLNCSAAIELYYIHFIVIREDITA